jgi:hypothetical protein
LGEDLGGGNPLTQINKYYQVVIPGVTRNLIPQVIFDTSLP